MKLSHFWMVLLLLSALLRISSFYYPFLDVDESQFATQAQALMDGGLPYRDAVDTKPPFVYFFFQFIFEIFGRTNMLAIHIVNLLWQLGVAAALWRLLKEFNQERAGRWAALFYVVFSTTYLPKFISTSLTAILILPITLSVLTWVWGQKQKKDFWIFVSGILSSVAFLFKFQAGIQIMVFFSVCVLQGYWREQKWKDLISRYSTYLVGFLFPIGITLGWIYTRGIWPDFVTWSVEGSAHYIAAGNQTISFFSNFFIRFGAFIFSTALLWILFIRFFTLRRFKTPSEILLMSWFFWSIVPVCVGGRFYGHYFIQLLPPLCALAAIATVAWMRVKTRKYWIIGMLLPALVFWLLRVDQRWTYEKFPDDSLFEQQEIGLWLKERTEPTDKFFVWGFATAIYFHAERMPATRFHWADLLTGKIPGSEKSNETNFDTSQFSRPEAWAALWEDFKKTPPAYVIDTSSCNIHNYGKYPIAHYPQLWDYIQTQYTLFGNPMGCAVYKRK